MSLPRLCHAFPPTTGALIRANLPTALPAPAAACNPCRPTHLAAARPVATVATFLPKSTAPWAHEAPIPPIWEAALAPTISMATAIAKLAMAGQVMDLEIPAELEDWLEAASTPLELTTVGTFFFAEISISVLISPPPTVT